METVKWTHEEFILNYSKEWEQLVTIIYWEHDIEFGWYLIKFNKNKCTQLHIIRTA